MNRKERLDISFAKGVAIFFVVIVHIMSRGHSQGNQWYSDFVSYTTLFHMAFFMFLSGFLYFKVGRLERLYEDYLPNMKKQAVRLLLPFFVIGGIIVFGKFAAQFFIHVDNVPDNPLVGLSNLFWHTKKSPAYSLWYIYAMFVYVALCPWLFRALKYKMHWWVLLAAVPFFLPSIHYMYLDKVLYYFVFFCLGGAAVVHEERYRTLIANKVFIFSAFLALALILTFFSYNSLDSKVPRLIVPCLFIPLLHQGCILITRYQNRVIEVVLNLGRDAYSIYLFNTICIGLVKGLIFKFVMDWHGANFYIVVPILIIAGLLGPLMIDRLILMRIPFIRQNILVK